MVRTPTTKRKSPQPPARRARTQTSDPVGKPRDKRQHIRIQPLHACARLQGNSGVALCHVRDLSAGGMLVSASPVLSAGQSVDSRLILQSQEPIDVRGHVVRADERGVAIQFLRRDDATRQRLHALVGQEQERTLKQSIIVAHRSMEEGIVLCSMMARMGLHTVLVQTPLELVTAIEHHGVPATSILLDEFFWGFDLGACSRALGERYPQLELVLLVRPCSDVESPPHLFSGVLRRPWKRESLEHHVRHRAALAS